MLLLCNWVYQNEIMDKDRIFFWNYNIPFCNLFTYKCPTSKGAGTGLGKGAQVIHGRPVQGGQTKERGAQGKIGHGSVGHGILVIGIDGQQLFGSNLIGGGHV